MIAAIRISLSASEAIAWAGSLFTFGFLAGIGTRLFGRRYR